MRHAALALLGIALGTLGALSPQDGETLAADLIDEHVSSAYRDFDTRATNRSETDEYMRRVYLDLIGVIPTVDEVLGFLPDRASNKREELINDLLDSRRYAYHWSVVWTEMLIGEDARRDGDVRQYIEPFRAWLQEQLHENRPFDAIVRDMVTASGRIDENPAVFYLAQNLFKETGRLDAAQDISQHFMGVRISCARCHDHPFSRWTQRNFYEMAAFLGRTELPRAREENRTIFGIRDVPNGEVRFPETNEPIPPRLLAEWEPARGASRRSELARLVTAPENLQFARGIVNRYWGYFFGRGFVHPADSFDDDNPPSHPELLDAVAQQFIDHGYDVKWLIRSIMNSDTYQLSSRIRGREPPDARAFASQQLRPMMPSQIADSLLRIAGFSDFVLRYGDRPEVGSEDARRNLQALFAVDLVDPSLYKVSMQQALAMMNSGLLHRLISCSDPNGLVNRIMQENDQPGAVIERLYLTILSRFPSQAEVTLHGRYVSSRGGQPEAFEDIAWALLNSGEFIFNH